ncbi:MAG: glycerol-3-phosphate dehydrogenase/oxidase [Myxococcales bacterium]
MSDASWTLRERHTALERLAREGIELAVIGGGITGAGVLRDAALRGLSCALFEREDFASGTSSHTSKMIHGGLRYIAEGQLGVTRESCLERELLARLNPNLVHPLPFLFCAFENGLKPWQVVAGMSLYSALSGFKSGFSLLSGDDVERLSRDVRKDILRRAALYHDQQVDDARIVLETVKDARRVGAEAISHADVVGFDKQGERITGLRVRDRLSGREFSIRAGSVVNAAGPSADRVRELDAALAVHELRPAKGVHLVIERSRVHAEAAVAFQAPDKRHMFLCPYQDVHLIGTTDTFTDEIDEPTVTRKDLHYLLAATNRMFSSPPLVEHDVISVFAGVRPLVADAHAEVPASSVSREHRITLDPSGLLSVAGGKLTTHRHMSEQIVDRVLEQLGPERRRSLKPCQTKLRPLRADRFEFGALQAELTQRFELDPGSSARLIGSWGADAVAIFANAPPEQRRPIGSSRYYPCEVARAFSHECAANLCDVLERRVRVAVFARGQGLPELAALAQVAAEVAGWDDARTRDEMQRYRELVQRRYRVQAS